MRLEPRPLLGGEFRDIPHGFGEGGARRNQCAVAVNRDVFDRNRQGVRFGTCGGGFFRKCMTELKIKAASQVPDQARLVCEAATRLHRDRHLHTRLDDLQH